MGVSFSVGSGVRAVWFKGVWPWVSSETLQIGLSVNRENRVPTLQGWFWTKWEHAYTHIYEYMHTYTYFRIIICNHLSLFEDVYRAGGWFLTCSPVWFLVFQANPTSYTNGRLNWIRWFIGWFQRRRVTWSDVGCGGHPLRWPQGPHLLVCTPLAVSPYCAWFVWLTECEQRVVHWLQE